MMNLLATVRRAFEPALAAVGADPAKVPDYLGMVKPASNHEHGDYQANFAMPLAKIKAIKPHDLADQIIRMTPTEAIESLSKAGPGFINVKLKSDFLATAVKQIAGDPRLGIETDANPKRFVIDYSSPNVAKPLHVGHLRSTVIGDALTRLLRFLGHTVITDNHLGDWGTQFGILLYGYKHLRNDTAFKADPVRELSRIYIEVRKLIQAEGGDAEAEEDAKTKIADACRAETAKLHAGDPENTALWKSFMPACMKEIHAVYRRLGTLPHDHEHGESFYNPMLAGVVEDVLKKGVAESGEGGAVIIRFSKDTVALVRKRDGAFTYMTSDLATIRHRVAEYKPDVCLYVVDFRQSQHFANLFAAAKRWGYDTVSLVHVSFGSVLNKSGQPISTRKGDGTELIDLIEKAVALGRQKYEETSASRKAMGHDVPDLSEAEKREIADAVGIGAVKYADLSQNRTSDYKFDYDKMLATDGNTATYMQYAYARCRAILRKGEVDEAALRAKPPAVSLGTTEERALALLLLRFPEALDIAAAEYTPHVITGYLWDLAKSLSRFYEACPVLQADSESLKMSRLLLVDLAGRVIQKALDLLGIRTVERM
jgi:arginyl-tRNA synthetase